MSFLQLQKLLFHFVFLPINKFGQSPCQCTTDIDYIYRKAKMKCWQARKVTLMRSFWRRWSLVCSSCFLDDSSANFFFKRTVNLSKKRVVLTLNVANKKVLKHISKWGKCFCHFVGKQDDCFFFFCQFELTTPRRKPWAVPSKKELCIFGNDYIENIQSGLHFSPDGTFPMSLPTSSQSICFGRRVENSSPLLPRAS